MNHLVLSPRYDVNDAARIFWRPRFRNAYGLLRRRPVKTNSHGLPASLELVWMPVYAFRVNLTRAGRRTAIWVSVDGSYGGFALFERLNELEEQEPEGERFEPTITHEAAERLARDGMVRFILRRRGTKPDIESIDDSRLYFTPVWVYYFYRLGRKLDLAVLDAYTGDTMGAQMRIAILEAFIRQRQGTVSK